VYVHPPPASPINPQAGRRGPPSTLADARASPGRPADGSGAGRGARAARRRGGRRGGASPRAPPPPLARAGARSTASRSRAPTLSLGPRCSPLRALLAPGRAPAAAAASGGGRGPAAAGGGLRSREPRARQGCRGRAHRRRCDGGGHRRDEGRGGGGAGTCLYHDPDTSLSI